MQKHVGKRPSNKPKVEYNLKRITASSFIGTHLAQENKHM